MPTTYDVLVVLDPLERLHPHTDSTYVMITEALARGSRVFAARQGDLSLVGPVPHATCVPVGPPALGEALRPRGEPRRLPLGAFGVVLMRKDPPVDADYLTATLILDRAPPSTLVLNRPQGLRDLNEKLAILSFPELIPETYLVRTKAELRECLTRLGGKMIVKPVFGFGGRDVLLAREGDPNLSALFEIATRDETTWTLAQAYLPEAAAGDKRILMVDGEPIGALLRLGAAGELRNNLHVGGQPVRTELNERDRAICAQVGPFLREHGQFFAGLDVIGGHLTEINVTSPTGMQEVNRLEGRAGEHTTQAKFWSALETMLGRSGAT